MPLVQLNKVNKVYQISEDVTFSALKNVTLSIDEREFAAIIGPSGSGKSTLMHIIGLLDQPSTGSYHLGGLDVSRLTENQLAKLRNRKIGFVFQNFNLLARTSAVENVALPLLYAGVRPLERLDRAKTALEKVGLSDKLGSKPNQLSGGQQQRVAIARALVNDPELLLADEPTGNLDSKSGAEIMKLFIKLHDEGRTIVIITHDLEIAQNSNRVISMKDGEIVI